MNNRRFEGSCFGILTEIQPLLVAFVLAGCGGDPAVRPLPPETAVPSPVARDASASFEERVRTIYNFKPPKVSDKDRELKSKEMDALWATVDKEPAVYLPKLREELKRKGQNRFFLFDGSQLLLKHSHTPEDLVLASDSMGQTDLEDVQPSEYFRSTHRLAVWGTNVWPCVNNILSDPGFKAFVPQHALTLDQTSVVIYCLLPMKEEMYLKALKDRLKGESDRVAVRSLLAGLSVAVTAEAQSALAEFARETQNREFRALAEPLTRLPSKKDFGSADEGNRDNLFEFLDDLVARRYENPAFDFQKFKKIAPALVKKQDLPKIRYLRQKHSARVSDEAIEEIQYLTLLMKVALGSEE